MNRFNVNLKNILKVLEDTSLSNQINSANMTGSELAAALMQQGQLAINAALQLEEIMLKEREMSINEEKARQELELGGTNSKALLNGQIAEALKSLVQSHSMAISVANNAEINKANCFIGLHNNISNASDSVKSEQYLQETKESIKNIALQPMNHYNTLLDDIKNNLNSLVNSQSNNKEVFILAAKLMINTNEPLKLLGCSVFGNNPTKFIINNETFENVKSIVIAKDTPQDVEVTFSALNFSNIWISDKVIIKIVES